MVVHLRGRGRARGRTTCCDDAPDRGQLLSVCGHRLRSSVPAACVPGTTSDHVLPRSSIDRVWHLLSVCGCFCFWAFTGTTCRVDWLYDPELERSSTKDLGHGRSTSSWASLRVLTDGRNTFQLHMSVNGDQAEIKPGTELFHRAGAMRPPLALGLPEPILGADHFQGILTDALAGHDRFTASYEGDGEVDGRPVSIVVTKRNGQVARRYWLDLERGAIPLRGEEYSADGRLWIRMIHRDVRELSGGRWLPYVVRWVRVISRDDVMVRQLEVTRFDADHAPARESLLVPVRAKTFLADEVHDEAYHVREDSLIGLGESAPEIVKGKLLAFAPTAPSILDEPARADTRRNGSAWPLLFTAAGLALAVCAVYVLVRIRKVAGRTS